MNLAEFFEEHGVEYRTPGTHHHTSHGWISVDCPMCSPGSSHFRLGINERSHASNCYVCGKQNTAYVLSILAGMPYEECKKFVGGMDAVKARKRPRGKLVMPTGSFPMIAGTACPGFSSARHREYLLGRGFNPDEIRKVWSVAATGQLSTHPWSLVIPIEDEHGEVVSFTTRQLHDKGIRYKSASPNEEVISHKEVLYGERLAGNAVIVVEGCLDVWKIGMGAVATFGLAVTDAQLDRLSRFARRVICLDAEGFAQRKAAKLADALGCFPGETIVVKLDSPDPGSATPEEIKELRKWLD